MTTFLDHIGIDPDDSSPYDLVAREEHANRNGVVHGGVLATLIDAAMGSAARAAVGYQVATVSLTVTFLAPGRVGETLQPVTQVLRSGSSLVMVEGWVNHGQGGEQVVHAVGTFAVMKSRPVDGR